LVMIEDILWKSKDWSERRARERRAREMRGTRLRETVTEKKRVWEGPGVLSLIG
jgi:hypothetical protein